MTIKTQVLSIATTLLALSIALPLQAQTALNAQDQTFLTAAAHGNLAEVVLGQLATQKGSNQAIKDFGNRMIADHSHAFEDLRGVAASLSVTIPSTMAAEDVATQQRLSALADGAFDQAYIGQMVNEHTQDARAFQQEIDQGQSEAVRAYAQRTLPVIEEHLTLARQIATQLGVNVP